MSIFCNKCGIEGLENSAFCGSCGAKLVRAVPLSVSPQVTVSSEIENVSIAKSDASIEHFSENGTGRETKIIVMSTGDQLECTTTEGVIVSSQESESIRIHQSTVIQDNQYKPGYISSSTVSTHKVWIRAKDGEEYCFNLSGMNLPMRESHVLKVYQVSSVGAEFCTVLRADNLSTRDVSRKKLIMGDFFDTSVWKIKEIGRFKDYLKVYLLTGGVPSLIVWSNSNSSWAMVTMILMSLPCLVIYLVAQAFGLTPGGRRRIKLTKEITGIVAAAS